MIVTTLLLAAAWAVEPVAPQIGRWAFVAACLIGTAPVARRAAVALSTGARRGLPMKGGAVIEAAARVRRMAFDKTGTLTQGRPVVIDLIPFGATTAADLLAIAAAAAAATWVTSPRYARANGGLDDAGLARATELEQGGKTAVAVYDAGGPLGLIAVRDEPRADAADGVAQLAAHGVTSVILTGDTPRTAAAIAGALGMQFRADMRPQDKLAAIRRMGEQGGVTMIGCGINDAPALKQARVGVAAGSGTDVALETADAAILRDRVTDNPVLIRLSRAAMARIRQNVALAPGLKAVFLVTFVLGLTGLWLAIMADTGATVLVRLNALGLLRFDPDSRA